MLKTLLRQTCQNGENHRLEDKFLTSVTSCRGLTSYHSTTVRNSQLTCAVPSSVVSTCRFSIVSVDMLASAEQMSCKQHKQVVLRHLRHDAKFHVRLRTKPFAVADMQQKNHHVNRAVEGNVTTNRLIPAWRPERRLAPC